MDDWTNGRMKKCCMEEWINDRMMHGRMDE